MKTLPRLILVAALVLGSSGLAQAEKSPAALPAALKGVAVAEIPAQAATLIAASPETDREATAIAMVSGAVKSYPAIASAIVGAVCTKCPEVAAVVARAAVSLQPKQAQIIARAAAAAAPAQTDAIVKALAALSESAPNLKIALTPVLASFQVAPSPASTSTAELSATEVPSVTRNVRGPIVSGPYIPLSGTPTNTPPGTPVPPGGRDYARP